MSAGTRDDGASLMVFCAQEFEAFFSYIGGAVKHYQITGQLPESLFKGHPQFQGGAGDKKAKARRKPTAFNMFVKDKMEEFKAAGIKLDDDKNGNLLFTLAVSEWKKLDDAAKQEYTRKFKAAEDADPTDDLDSTPADLAVAFAAPSTSAAASSGLFTAALAQSPIDPGFLAASPATANADVATKKRKMREAEQQPLLQAPLPCLQAPLSPASVAASSRSQQKKLKDIQQAEQG